MLLGAASCAHRSALGSGPRSFDIDGLEATLLPEPHVRAAIGGEVHGRSAEIRVDYAEPLTTVTRGCFPKGEFIDSGQTLEFPTPSGTPQALSMVSLRGVVIAGRPVGGLSAGMIADEARCTLTLGSDALANYAVTIDPATRRIRFEKTKSRERYVEEVSSLTSQQGPDELHLLDVSKEPNADWPLIAVRARQGQGQVMGPFILSLVEPRSAVVGDIAGEAGLTPNSEFLEDLPLPAGVKLPEKLSARVFPVDSLELSPGFGMKRATLAFIEGWKKPAALGVIGSDVWGRFRMTLDPGAGVLLLRRPRVFSSGPRQQCSAREPGKISEEACFELGGEKLARGVEAIVTLWRDSPDGARVYLELLDERGAPLRSECRVGISFHETDRGASARHRLPWAGLEKTFPECTRDFLDAKSVALGLYEDGALAECPGQCGFVHETSTGRISCECQSALGNISDSERKFLEMYRQLMKRSKSRSTSPVPERPKFDGGEKPPPKEEPEPEEP